MLSQRLIFSDKRSARIKRHLLFWFCYWIYFGSLHASNPFGAKEIMYFQNLPFTISESLLMLIPQMVTVYPMIYIILPKFIRKEYLGAIALVIAMLFIGAFVSLMMIRNVNHVVLEAILPEKYMRHPDRLDSVSFFMGLMLAMKGSNLANAFALGIKLMKHFYIKEQKNMQLQTENTEAQLRLLTAQVHPHFLFNTLNNIFSQTQLESPKGSKMIMGLSDLLRYVLYEGRKPLVPLKKELAMINEYINLEKIRYGNKLDVHVVEPDAVQNIYIAPLIILPFIENCFKHGSSSMLQNPWINFTVELRDTTLVMKLMNGKAPHKERIPEESGIGINNVRQRLDLLYKDNYELKITEDEEVFIVDLTVKLVRMNSIEQIKLTAEPATEKLYA